MRKTVCIDEDGNQLAVYPDILRTELDAEFYVAQKPYTVSDITPDGEDCIVIILKERKQ